MDEMQHQIQTENLVNAAPSPVMQTLHENLHNVQKVKMEWEEKILKMKECLVSQKALNTEMEKRERMLMAQNGTFGL